MSITFTDIWNRADELTQKTGPRTLVLMGARDEYSMKSIKSAAENGWIKPVIARLKGQIKLEEQGDKSFNTSEYEVIAADDDRELVKKAVKYVEEQQGLLMRGRVPASTMIYELVQKENDFTLPGRLLTHVGCFESEKFPRLILVSDGGVNIKPTLDQKPSIVKNAVEIARKIGITRPKVAMLEAVESVYLSMGTALDDAVISKMADRGDFGDAIVDGPLSFDVALVEKAAKEKKVKGEVAGKADILIVSRIEVGNGLYKTMFMFGHARSAGIVTGGKFPVVMTSRSESLDSKMNSIALAIIASA